MEPWLLVVIELIGIGVAVYSVARARSAKRNVNMAVAAAGIVVGLVAIGLTLFLSQPSNGQFGIGGAVVADMLLFGSVSSSQK